jgi:glycosyltransferase involved in cell wall biosynthesis
MMGERPMRVLHLLATGNVGGAQGSAMDLMRRLDPRRFAVEAVYMTDGPAVARTDELGISVTVLDEPDDRIAVRRLVAHLREREPDLLHAHMYRAELLGARAARLAGTPVTVATVHSSRVRSRADVAALAALTPLFDLLVVPSAAIAAKARREGRGAAAITVIPNGVDPHRFAVHRSPPARAATRVALGIPATAFLVGTVARLEPEKGHRYLLDAWSAIAAAAPDPWLLLVGNGSLADALHAQARALPAEAARRIVFSGGQTKASTWTDVAPLTAALDLAVLPSLREAQGIAILEAMAAGVPVVASAVGGIPASVRDGVDGLLVPPADSDALAAAVLRLAQSASTRRAMESAARLRATTAFSLAATVDRHAALYAALRAEAALSGRASLPRSASAPAG